MNVSLDFRLRGKVAIVTGGGAVGKDIGNGRVTSILLAVEGDGWDIGKAVVYLSSNWSIYITGHLMVVDAHYQLNLGVSKHKNYFLYFNNQTTSM